MGPSYQVTRDEKHSTRGRAHLLFEMLRGEVIKDGWDSHEVKEALDLCLACKGCKGECPTNVDMATYKAEFLAHYHQHHFRPRHAYSMGQIYRAARAGNLAPRVANFFTQTTGLSALTKEIGGIHAKRKIPRFAAKSFRKCLPKNPVRAMSKKPVYLWADTFNNAFNPEIAMAAYRVLHKAGFDVRIPGASMCCGRPLYDYGFLPEAKNRLKKILNEFRGAIREGVDFVFLEPSCASVFKEELVSLFPHDLDAIRLSQQIFMLSDFLLKKVSDFEWPRLTRKILVQGHCHHHSVLDFESEKLALMKTGAELDVLDAGCCGMAGSFGFSKEHYEISQAIGERSLFKKIRDEPSETMILANGFSCREQIQQATGRRTFHIAQILDPEFHEEC